MEEIGKRYMFKETITEIINGKGRIHTIIGIEAPDYNGFPTIKFIQTKYYHPMFKEYKYNWMSHEHLMKHIGKGTIIPIGIKPMGHIEKHVFIKSPLKLNIDYYLHHSRL